MVAPTQIRQPRIRKPYTLRDLPEVWNMELKGQRGLPGEKSWKKGSRGQGRKEPGCYLRAGTGQVSRGPWWSRAGEWCDNPKPPGIMGPEWVVGMRGGEKLLRRDAGLVMG